MTYDYCLYSTYLVCLQLLIASLWMQCNYQLPCDGCRDAATLDRFVQKHAACICGSSTSWIEQYIEYVNIFNVDSTTCKQPGVSISSHMTCATVII